MRPLTTRLFWKLAATYLLLLGVALVATDLYALRALHRDYLRAAFDALEVVGRLAGQPGAGSGDLARWAAELSRSGARITVVARDGRVLADSAEDPARMENHGHRPEIEAAFRDGEGRAVRHSNTIGRDLVYLAVRHPGVGSSGPIVLRASLPLRRVEEALAEFRMRLWLASLVALALAGGGLLLFVRRFSRRIGRLEQFSRRVAGGDFEPLPQDRSRDELANLGRTLNETALRLDQTIRTLTGERNRSSAILESMVEGVAVIGPDQRVLFCNPAFAAALSIPSSGCEGRLAAEVIRESDLLELVQTALASGQSVHRDILTGTVRTHTFAATAAPIRSDQAPSGAVLVLHDITEIRRLERARRDFVANVSHEFRTPLASIQGFAETLLSGALDDRDNRVRFLEIIRDQAIRLGRLTSDLLELAQIEAGKLTLEPRALSWEELVTPCLESLRLRASEKPIEVAAEYAPDLPPLVGDLGALQRVLQNLLDNALRYTPRGGRIAVRVSAEPGGSVLEVADTGIGIPRSEQGRIFERFYRVDPARSRDLGGTGLGLAIVKHLVELHGGRIEVESEVGRGTTFRVHLPNGPAHSAA